ncbi:hypothetical protein JYU34_001714 [Plutella xylostella]|uniref:EF-hand domain-containing protein n=1 Tax=Plutella xylostella TaxID=51655 RepID=A0ABQ7R4L5_PLUXY|nr:hypothetical protein JYU34_001714 [Plutella xylostella]
MTYDILNPLNTITRFTQEQINDINEWFSSEAKPLLSVDDSDPINVVTVEQFEQFLGLKKYHRRNFYYPTYAEIMKEVERLKMGTTRVLTEKQVFFLLNKWLIHPEIKKELLLAFRAFDTEKRNFLDTNELIEIVTKDGDLFDEAEKIEMLRDANIHGDGNIYYEDFIESMFIQFPQLNQLKTEYLYLDPEEDPSVPPLPPSSLDPELEPEEEVSSPQTKKSKGSSKKPKGPKSKKGKKGKSKKI